MKFFQHSVLCFGSRAIQQVSAQLCDIARFDLPELPIFDVVVTRQNVLLLTTNQVLVISVNRMEQAWKVILQSEGKVFKMQLFCAGQVLVYLDDKNHVRATTGLF